MKPLLEDASILKIGQNLKFDFNMLARHGIRIAALDDTMLMSYALDGGKGSHGMDELAMRHLGHACISFEHVMAHVPGKKSERTFAHVPLDKATEYAAEDADVTLRLWMMLKPRLAAERVGDRLRDAGAPAHPRHRRHGARRHQGRRRDPVAAVEHVRTRHGAAGGRGGQPAGHKFNLGSPRQLGELLFDRLKLPGGKHTKSGQWETRAGLLDDLAANEELPEDARRLINVMLEWRQLTKLRSTYTDALPGYMDAGTGPHSHLLLDGRHDDGAAGVVGAQPAEHPHPHQGRPRDPHRLHR